MVITLGHFGYGNLYHQHEEIFCLIIFATQLKIISQTFDMFKMVHSVTHNAVVASICSQLRSEAEPTKGYQV
jgi:hypothetical protein